MFEDLVRDSAAYYTRCLRSHGPTARGVDWNSPESQRLRFEQLLRVCSGTPSFSINDYGCGYGALSEYLEGDARVREYRGYDASEEMTREAQRFTPRPGTVFSSRREDLTPADYTVASGLFNVRESADPERWQAYVLETIHDFDRLSVRGFAFNVLTSYSDPERMRPTLYYADPCFYFDYAKRNFSRDVYLLHDYGLYEFTIGVRKNAPLGGPR